MRFIEVLCCSGDYHILDVPKGAYQVRIDIKTGSDVRAELSKGYG